MFNPMFPKSKIKHFFLMQHLVLASIYVYACVCVFVLQFNFISTFMVLLLLLYTISSLNLKLNLKSYESHVVKLGKLFVVCC